MADDQNIKTSDKVFLLADKTTNIYKVSVDLYKKKLILNNVTKDYIQISEENVDKINQEAAILASELELADILEFRHKIKSDGCHLFPLTWLHCRQC